MRVFLSINMSVNVELVKMRTILERTGGKLSRLPANILSIACSSMMSNELVSICIQTSIETILKVSNVLKMPQNDIFHYFMFFLIRLSNLRWKMVYHICQD